MSAPSRTPDPFHVVVGAPQPFRVIAGGGVAALEAALALRGSLGG